MEVPVLEPVAGVDTEEAPVEVGPPVVAGAELPTETLEEPPVKQESLAARYSVVRSSSTLYYTHYQLQP